MSDMIQFSFSRQCYKEQFSYVIQLPNPSPQATYCHSNTWVKWTVLHSKSQKAPPNAWRIGPIRSMVNVKTTLQTTQRASARTIVSLNPMISTSMVVEMYYIWTRAILMTSTCRTVVTIFHYLRLRVNLSLYPCPSIGFSSKLFSGRRHTNINRESKSQTLVPWTSDGSLAIPHGGKWSQFPGNFSFRMATSRPWNWPRWVPSIAKS